MVRVAQPLSLAASLAIAAALRFGEIGRASLWYDEIVTMRLARQPGPSELVRLLFEIDATRAPLHPILLQAWLLLTGPSDAAGRSFSAVCGLLTVLVVHAIGRETFGRKVGITAAWLLAIAPALVRYSREARMYSWLVLITSLAWWLMLRASRPSSTGPSRDRLHLAGWSIAMTAIVYSHPLGLLMNAALMAGSLLVWKRSWRGWLLVQTTWIATFAPWARFYFDHPPESVVDRASIRILMGMPIEFLGGNFATLAVAVGLIGWGLYSTRTNLAWRALLAWFAIPPLILFGYSQVGHPLFGPARYTLFVAPAFLIMVAVGLSKLPHFLAIPIALGGTVLAGTMLSRSVFRDDLKADWRQAAIELDRIEPRSGVVIVATDAGRNVEVETARYYLPHQWRAVPEFQMDGAPWSRSADLGNADTLAFAVGVRNGQPIRPVGPAFRDRGETIHLPGLDLVVIRRSEALGPMPSDRASDR